MAELVLDLNLIIKECSNALEKAELVQLDLFTWF